jgi:hypothetical protein
VGFRALPSPYRPCLRSLPPCVWQKIHPLLPIVLPRRQAGRVFPIVIPQRAHHHAGRHGPFSFGGLHTGHRSQAQRPGLRVRSAAGGGAPGDALLSWVTWVIEASDCDRRGLVHMLSNLTHPPLSYIAYTGPSASMRAATSSWRAATGRIISRTMSRTTGSGICCRRMWAMGWWCASARTHAPRATPWSART